MQLAPIAPTFLAQPVPGAAPMPWAALPDAARLRPVGAADAARPPIVDFPGIGAGDEFDVVKGSKVGPIGVRGEARIERFDPDHATFRVAGGRFGFKVDVLVDIVQVDDGLVRISATGEGIPDMSELGRIVEQQTNRAVFEQVSDPSRRTVITHDGEGRIVIDTVIPTLGETHLRLQRREPVAPTFAAPWRDAVEGAASAAPAAGPT